MMPKKAFDVCKEVVGAAYARNILMKGPVDEETKTYLEELNGSEWDTVDQIEVAML